MKNRSGLTLIEVILAIAILSILLITYITAFGQNAIIVSRGKDITNDTFSYQETMENKIVEGKKSFIENNEKEDYKIEIFNGDYKSTIDTKEIKTDIKGNRQYIAYVTNYEIKEPESPKIDPFEVGVYDSKGNRVFPWYEDDIRIKANYTLKPNPLIYENRIRWYRSKEGILNPVFASEYDIVYEEIQKEPSATSYTKLLTKEDAQLKPKQFYYFEARPYTLAGRLEYFRNEVRILVLNRAGSKEWQNFMEDIYFNKATIKKFNINNKDIYIDIMQNPNHPTLNLDWKLNEDPQGALIAMNIPINNEQISIDFQIDQSTLMKNIGVLGIGVGLVDNNNTGIMITFDVDNNLIRIDQIINGQYANQQAIKVIKILEDPNFSTLLETVNGESRFNWSKEYKVILTPLKNESKISLQIQDKNDNSGCSEPIHVGLIDNLSYLGFKSYSGIDYKPDLRFEIVDKYDRNYSSHFYNVEFKNEDWILATNNLFYNGNSHVVASGEEPDLKIKMTRVGTKSSGNKDFLVAKAFWFAPEIKQLEIGNNHSLDIKAEEVIFDVPITFDKNAVGINIMGINNDSYPVKVYFIEGDRVKINNNTIKTLVKGQHIAIESGFINIKGSNGVINITGNDVQIVSD